MKQIISLTFFFLFFSQISFSQNDVSRKYEQAIEAYNQEKYQEVVLIIKELTSLYKTVPPKVLSLEILAKTEIIKINPLNDYPLISDTRNQANKYLNNPNNKRDKNYNYVVKENVILKTYPKDLATFNSQKQEFLKEEALQKELNEKAIVEEKARQAAAAIALQKKLEQEKIINDRAVEVAEQNRIATGEAAKQREAQVEKNKIAETKAAEKERKKLKSFSSLGFQSGQIAKYGILYEHGGKKTVGFRFSARTSLTSEEDIINGNATENKTEIELGPNFKIIKRLYLNLGIGYGYYDRIIKNDYAGILTLEKTGYSVATAGLVVRLTRVININGGVSFMDIEKDLYKPEITFGFSFNLKGNQ